ncbi:MAG TPA: NUDIX domain-containing protein [Flavobacterium sp.]|nr:NUDIX domain-containing protein [Flavobacterium sp.]
MNDFVIRVYALIINANHEILLTDEFQLNTKMTKFPGGGLEFGEGIIECLAREMAEECNGQEIENIRHFYTTEFYQKALFYENKQLLSIYFLTDLKHPIKFRISTKPFDFDISKGENQSFRWVKINTLYENDLSFPIDRFVAGKLKEFYK